MGSFLPIAKWHPSNQQQFPGCIFVFETIWRWAQRFDRVNSSGNLNSHNVPSA
jgi:hypothetical protein